MTPEWDGRTYEKEIGCAFHEAGHAVAAEIFGICVEYADIIPNDKDHTSGGCGIKTIENTGMETRGGHVFLGMSGPAASRKYTRTYLRRKNTWWKHHGKGDIEDIYKEFFQYFPELNAPQNYEEIDDEPELLIPFWKFIEEPGVWDAIEQVAHVLLYKKKICGDLVRHIVSRNIPKQRAEELRIKYLRYILPKNYITTQTNIGDYLPGGSDGFCGLAVVRGVRDDRR